MLTLSYVGILLKDSIEVNKITYTNFQHFKDNLIKFSQERGFEVISQDQIKFFYTDEDNDQITISSDEDIKAFNEIKDSVKLYLEGFKQTEIKIETIVRRSSVRKISSSDEIKVVDENLIIPGQEENKIVVNSSTEVSDAVLQEKIDHHRSELINPENVEIKQENSEKKLDSPKQQNFYQVHSAPKKEFLTLSKEELNELIKNQVEQQLIQKIPDIVNQAAQQSQLMSSQIFLGQSQVQPGVLGQSKIPNMKQSAQVMAKIKQSFTSSQNELIKLLNSLIDEESLKKFDLIQNQLQEDMGKIRTYFQGQPIFENSIIQVNSDPLQLIKQQIQKPQIPQDFPPLQPPIKHIDPKEEKINNQIKLIQEVYGGDHQQIKKFVTSNQQITNLDELIFKYELQYLSKK